MSRSVDTRVVEMRFDNKQFENGVKHTLSTLSRLKEALKIQDSSKALENLEKKAKDIKLDGIAAGVDLLQKRFSTLGIVGMTTISNITNSLIGKFRSAVNFVTDAVVSGGIRRAMNIENAHFQLQALLKDETKVQAVMADAMESVDGTAYAYDEAAKAASQFAASGIQAGEEMLGALKGITGVAAMTNSDFESISMIFTTVAGNGRLMGDQLLQLSSRGLNAASTLADYFREVRGQSSMTEGAIREMVSAGEISFRDFSDAMTWAFGDSAKRANETFNGALSNMKSAFARIGAGFISPLVEQNGELVNLFNAIRVKVNDVKSALVFDEQRSAVNGLAERTKLANDELNDMFTTIKSNGSVTGAELSKLEENGANATNALTTYINGVVSGRIRASYAIKSSMDELTNGVNISMKDVRRFVDEGKIDLATFTSAMEHAYGKEKTLTKQFTDFFLDHMQNLVKTINKIDMTEPMSIFYYWVESVKNVLKGLLSVLRPVGKAFSDVFFDFGTDDVLSFSAAVEQLTSKLKLSSYQSNNLHDTIEGLLSVAKLFIDIGIKLIGLFIPINEPIVEMGDGILGLTGTMGRGLTAMTNWIRNLPVLSKGYDTTKTAISGLMKVLSFLIKNLNKAGKIIARSSVVQKTLETIKKVLNDFGKTADVAFDRALVGFSYLSNKIAHWSPKFFVDGLKDIVSYLKDLKDLNPEDIGVGLSGISDRIKESINKLVESNEGLASFITMAKKFSQDLSDAFSSDNISDRLTKVMQTFGEFTNWIKTTFQTTFSGFSIPNAVGAAGGLGIVYSLIKMSQSFDKAMSSIKSIPDLLGKVGGAISAYQQELKSEAILNVAKAIIILAGALVILSFVDAERLMPAAFALSAVSVAVLAFAERLVTAIGKANESVDATEIFAKKIGEAAKKLTRALEIHAFGSAVLKFAISIGIIAASIAGLAYMYSKDSDSLMKGVEIIAKVGVAVFAAVLALTILDSVLKEGNGGARFESIGKMMLAVTISLGIVIFSLNKLFKMELPRDFGEKLIILGFIFGGLATLLIALGVASRIAGDGKLAATTLVASCALLSSIVTNLGKLFKMELPNDYLKKLGILGLIFVGFAGLVISLGVATRIAGQEMTAGGEIMAMTAFITAAAGALMTLSLIPGDKLLKASAALAGVLGGLALTFLAMSKMEGAEGAGDAVAGMAKVIGAITASLGVLALIDAKALAKAVIALDAVLLSLAETFKGMRKIKSNTYKSVIAMCVMVGEIGAILFALSLRPWDQLLAAALSISVTMVAMAQAFKLIGDSGKIKMKKMSMFLALTLAVVPIIMMLEILSSCPWDGLIGAGVGLSATILALSQAFKIISKSDDVGYDKMLQFSMILIPLTGIAIALGVLAQQPIGGMLAAAVSLSAALLALGASFKIIASTGDVGYDKMLQFSMMLIPLVGITIALGWLAEQPFGGMLAAALALSAVLLAMSVAFVITSKAKPNVDAVLMMLAGTIAILGVCFVIKELSNQPVEGMTAAAEAIGKVLFSMAIVMAICALVGKFASGGALAGIGLLELFIVSFAGVLAALGALFKSDAAQSLLSGGVEILLQIGTAIGQFVGNIVAGVLTSITGALPQVGLDLSAFMVNLTPFIMGAKMLDEESLKNVGMLADIVILLTVGEFIDGVAKLFGASLPDLGLELSAFMANLTPFIMGTGMLNKESMEACLLLAQMVNSLTSAQLVNGIGEILGMNGGFAQFGEELASFGPDLVTFANDVQDITPEMVEGAKGAADIMVALAKSLPGTGGIIQAIFGEKSLADFGEELASFGPDLVTFANDVQGVNSEMVEGAKAAADIMVELNDKLPRANGFAQKIFGDQSLADFGHELMLFGWGLVKFVESTSDISSADVVGAAAAAEIMATLSEKLPKTETLWEKWFGGGKSFSDFGEELEKFAEQMVSFSNGLDDMNYENVEKFSKLVGELIDMALTSEEGPTFSGLDGLSTFDMSGPTESLEAFVQAIKDQIPKAIENTKELLNKIIQTLRSRRDDFKATGEDAIAKYFEGFTFTEQNAITISNVVNQVIKALEASDDFKLAGENAAKGFIAGLSSMNDDAYNAGHDLGTAAAEGTKKGLDERSPSHVMEKIANYAGLGFILKFKQFAKQGYEQGRLLGESVGEGTSSGLVMVQDAMTGFGFHDPVIKPIVDIGDARSKASEISSMLGQAIRTTALLAGDVGITMSARRSQNEILSDEMRGLRSDLKDLQGDTYNINGLEYTERSDVADAIQTLIRATNLKRRG